MGSLFIAVYALSPLPTSIECGNSKPSSYCLKRTGGIKIEGHSLDYDPECLEYKIPYLFFPDNYRYFAEIVTYTPSQLSFTTSSEDVEFNGIRIGSLSLSPGKSDTLYSYLPSVSDGVGILRIKGNPALLERVKIYRLEIVKDLKGINTGVDNYGKNPEILNEFYNIWSDTEVWKKIEIYDASGRLVKRLDKGSKVYWDGRDVYGNRVPSGVYFVRLEKDGKTVLKKILLMR